MVYFKSVIEKVEVADTSTTLTYTLALRASVSEDKDPSPIQSIYMPIDIDTFVKLKHSLHAKSIDDLAGKEISFIPDAISPQIAVDFYIRGTFENVLPKQPLHFDGLCSSLHFRSFGNGHVYHYKGSIDDLTTLKFLLGRKDIKEAIFFPKEFVTLEDSEEECQLHTTVYFPCTMPEGM